MNIDAEEILIRNIDYTNNFWTVNFDKHKHKCLSFSTITFGFRVAKISACQ